MKLRVVVRENIQPLNKKIYEKRNHMWGNQKLTFGQQINVGFIHHKDKIIFFTFRENISK
jgi:gamma-glutamyl:cysteine ligase YbdK (ATP-grasp superfamily)